mmetsp:Transcript_7679/g.15426  ORF Transcript_7679/g.15426 Transcript_7679/m.15426 type:complete len:298 (-) Transcript_7679:84-977(-)|eukprot:CAMPEP_0118642048 /NCGR_PEP_ID=MMETSP0785-20121206/5632_1 /TAXON_ID=91992 /ORGANISM="Bolidomonas pacifica, Strain CCMP 1866" /LENGTH=297 /DNA_ID=CAMNT_0006533583 /DNA_START=692 /DNA_END=1585 /DNA_ORIENTATION=+
MPHFSNTYDPTTLVEFLTLEEYNAHAEMLSPRCDPKAAYLEAVKNEESNAEAEMLSDRNLHGIADYVSSSSSSNNEEEEEAKALIDCLKDTLVHGGYWARVALDKEEKREQALMDAFLSVHGKLTLHKTDSEISLEAITEMLSDKLIHGPWFGDAVEREKLLALADMMADHCVHGASFYLDAIDREEATAFAEMMADENVHGSWYQQAIEKEESEESGMFFELDAGVQITGDLDDPLDASIHNLRTQLVALGVENNPQSDSDQVLIQGGEEVPAEEKEGKLSRSPSGVDLCDLTAYA